jgi:hypothetical protein
MFPLFCFFFLLFTVSAFPLIQLTRIRGRCVALCCTVFSQFLLLTVNSLLLNEMVELLPKKKQKKTRKMKVRNIIQGVHNWIAKSP